MKTPKILYLLFISVYLSSFTSCNDDNNIGNKPTISISEANISFEAEGGQKEIHLTTNRDWIISDIPNWISIDKQTGNGSSEEIITLTTLVNNDFSPKEATLKITSGDISTYLKISQKEAIEKRTIEWESFQTGYFNSIKHTIGENNTERNYFFQTDNLFINPDIEKKIYVGNIINSNLKSNTNIVEYKGYTYNPITISPSIVVKNGPFPVLTMNTPTKEDYDAFVQKVIDNRSTTQNLSFSYSNKPAKYFSYRQLHLLGVGNIGIKLDEVVSGQSYRNKEMSKKTGLLYSFCLTSFSIDMNLPEKLVKEEVKQEDLADGGFSYISSVNYGRTGFLLVESDTNTEQLRITVNKVLANGALTTEDNAILDGIDAYYIYYDKGYTLKKITGKTEVIKKYVSSISANDGYIQPLTFSVSNYPDSSQKTISFSLNLP